MKTKVVIVANSSWNLVNFRSGLIGALLAKGYDVLAISPEDEHAYRLLEMGCKFVPLPMDNKGTNFRRDFSLFLRFYKILRNQRPDIFLSYTIKPNIYGSLAANMLSIPVINNISGLGAVFIKRNLLTHFVKFLYRFSLARSNTVFFQNNDDCKLFIDAKLVNPSTTSVLPGSGVDLTKFYLSPINNNERVSKDKPFRFLLVARMLWDKGVGEYVKAAQILSERYKNVEFCLLGPVDVQNPSAITKKEINEWVAAGFVKYLGVSDDIRSHIDNSHCLVLPSYREGTPRSLLEASAMGRPIITTDAPGCRDVVEHGLNGYLCRLYDPLDLAEKMEKIASMSIAELEAMGAYGRKKMEMEYDENIVINKYCEVISSALNHTD